MAIVNGWRTQLNLDIPELAARTEIFKRRSNTLASAINARPSKRPRPALKVDALDDIAQALGVDSWVLVRAAETLRATGVPQELPVAADRRASTRSGGDVDPSSEYESELERIANEHQRPHDVTPKTPPHQRGGAAK